MNSITILSNKVERTLSRSNTETEKPISSLSEPPYPDSHEQETAVHVSEDAETESSEGNEHMGDLQDPDTSSLRFLTGIVRLLYNVFAILYYILSFRWARHSNPSNYATEEAVDADELYTWRRPRLATLFSAAGTGEGGLRKRRSKSETSEEGLSGNETLSSQVRPRHVERLKLYNEFKSPLSPSEVSIRSAPRPPHPSRLLLSRPTKRKTLILDLDETLVHSLAKGNHMSDGHMVEVKLEKHALLYYVYKRPYCDLFLRRVSKWFRLVIFTASVQEYADPVIDWLELDHTYFSARYYRQHCSFRSEVYAKDLTICEPDLARVIIVDNSPMSYAIQEGK